MARRGHLSYSEFARLIEEARAAGATELDLSGHGLSEFPDAIGQLSQLQDLDLCDNQLTELPDAIGQLSQLQDLDLRDNHLTELPDAIAQLSQLQSLDLSGNQLTELADAIGQLSQLQDLDLRDNYLTELPGAIGQLSQLRGPDLRYNQLTELPDAIGQLNQLQRLDLSHNGLTGLPEAFFQLNQLERLDLRANLLEKLPQLIGHLSRLRGLSLGDNRLLELPESIKDLALLDELYLHNNPNLQLPREMLGPPAEDVYTLFDTRDPAKPQVILEYYFRTRRDLRPLNEAKLILVGYGSVGKTSLVNRLAHDTFDAAERKTEGINITQWLVSLRDDEDVRLHIWDFGGQEIMHSTHQFFLTQRSLYLLVLNGRQGHEDADADYWLSLIDSFGEGSPVLVVLNKIKEHPFDLNRRGLMQKFGIVRGFVETDCQDRTGIEDLKKAIIRETDRLEHLRDAFPASWFGIKDRLAGMQANYISYDEYRKICRENGEGEGAAQEALASYLHTWASP